MPIQAPQWTEFLSCPVCCNEFDGETRIPLSLACGHTLCRACLASLHRQQCPFDQSHIRVDVLKLPANNALLRLVGASIVESDVEPSLLSSRHVAHYRRANRCIEDLALYLPHFSTGAVSVLSRPMQRKLVTLANCQLLESEGRARALRAARSLGERTVTELLLQHQNPQQLSANLWAAVRSRGCQFLGPAMQEEVLKLVLLALEDGSPLSRKVLVMFVVQRLEPHYTQASKTSIGHVVQLLYRASCFKVSKREGDSSLMQLKEEFRSYEALRREHDAQIVQIATEAGLRIAPDQWSSLLYGDTAHKSHMQSIMDKLQTPQSFSQSVQELLMALQRSGDPGGLGPLRPQLEHLASIDPSPEAIVPTWEQIATTLEAARIVVAGLAEFVAAHGSRRVAENHPAPRYKVSMCRDLGIRGTCPRGPNCTFAHSETELERFRARARKALEGSSSGRTNNFDSPPAFGPNVYSPSVAYPTNGGYMWYFDKERLFTRNASTVLLAASNGEHVDAADIPCTQTILGKGGGVHEVQNLAYEASMCDPIVNMNLIPPLWHRPHTPHGQVTVNQLDAHFYLPPPQTIESQRMKQLRNLEMKIMDLQLAKAETSRHSDADNICRFEDSLQEEELYEAGIAEDMRVLEERWECELAEQERRWSESDARPN